MSIYKVYYAGQPYRINNLVVKDIDMEQQEQDVLSYTYSNGIYTMTITNPSLTTTRLLTGGNLILGISVKDTGRGSCYFQNRKGRTRRVSPKRRPWSIHKDNCFVMDTITNFTFTEQDIVVPVNLNKQRVNFLDEIAKNKYRESDMKQELELEYMFFLKNKISGRNYKKLDNGTIHTFMKQL